MELRDNKPKRAGLHSLRSMMALLILLCWVLPILFIVGLSAYLTNRTNHNRVSEVVTISIDNATDTIRRDLDGVVADALSASYISTIRTAYTQYRRDGNYTELYTTASSFLAEHYSRNPSLRAAYLVFPEVAPSIERPVYTLNQAVSTFPDAMALYASGFFDSMVETLPALDTDVVFKWHDERLFLVRALSWQDNRFFPYGMLVLEIDTGAVFESLNNLPWVTDAEIFLDDIGVRVEGDAPLGAVPAVAPGQYGVREEEGHLLVWGSHPGQRFAFQYAVRADLAPLLAQNASPMALILGLAALSVPLLAGVFVFYHRKVTRPINVLGSLTHQIAEGEFGKHVAEEKLGSQEFYTLGSNLNTMSDRLDYQFKRIYDEELALRDARIKALQSQINPHFLGNTLEIINWEARLSGNVKMSRMLESLNTMIEATLDRRKRPFVHLSEEMMYVNSYLLIIKERLGKRLEVRQEIDEKLLDWFVPRLILQPIVENAIEHGVSNQQHGKIVIRARRIEPPPRPEGQPARPGERPAGVAEQWMRLEVENDAPMNPEDEARVKLLLEGGDAPDTASGSIGIRNVNQRLLIIYGPQSGLSIKNTKNGTVISSMCIRRGQEPQIESR